MHRPLSILALLGLGLAAPRPVAAQRYLVHTYAEAAGLPSSTVRSIVQSPDGLMWFATRSGVASYDGRDWVTYGPRQGLRDPEQAHLAVDQDGGIWAVASGPGLRVSRLDGDAWHALPPADTKSTEWQGVAAFTIARRSDRTYVMLGAVRGSVHVWNGTQWSSFSTGRELRVESIFADGDRLFLGDRMGLVSIPVDAVLGTEPEPAPATVRLDSTGGWIRGVHPELERGWIWLVGEDWIGRVEDGSFVLVGQDLDFGFPPAHESVIGEEDGNGGLFFGNAWRCLHFHPDLGLTSLREESGLISEGSTSLYRDREGNVWVGSLRGLSKIISRRFANYDREHGLFDDEVSAVLERADGEYVLGHGGGLTFLGDRVRTLHLSDEALQGRILDLAEDGDGRLWVAANYEGLLQIEGHRIVHRYGREHGIGASISGVAIDREGNLWVGGDGIHRMVGGEFERVALPPNRQEQTPYIRRVIASRTGGVFVASGHNGLYRVRDGGSDYWVHDELHSPANQTFTVFETADGTILVGTRGGLYRATAGRLEKVVAPGPAIDRPVYMIVTDSDRRLWFGTDNGVLRWDGRRLEHLTVRHGLVGAEANRAAGLLDSHGRVWIGMDRGVSVYHREFDRSSRVPPLVALGHADVGNASFPLDQPLSLSHDRNSPVFTFRAISFADEARVRFRYRLEGFDEEWSSTEPLPQRTVRYTNLPPGEYRLHLRAVDIQGVESRSAISAPIVVRRPLHSTPWFLAMVAMIAFAMLYGIVSYASQRKYARQLRHEVRERTAALRASEGAAAAERNRLAVMLASIADGVAATDASGRIVLWNGAAERITGRDARTVDGLGLEVAFAIERDDDGSRADELRACAGGSGPMTVNGLSIRTATGRVRLLDVSGAPLDRSRGAAGAVLAFRDVTTARQAATELAKTERLESLGILAGGIAHDFNNLLTVVLGGLSLLDAERAVAPSSRQLLGEVRAATHRARSLTEQLLTFSKGGAPVRRAASIGEVIHETSSFVLRGANVRAQIDVDRDLSVVEIDEGQMSQVINNLLINARQAMPDGGAIRIRGRNLSTPPPFLPPGNYVLIEVEDEGPGISRENLARVFDPYFSTKEGGSGLGLAVAHSIVAGHEGRLTVHSQPGDGTVFRIYLPASEAPIEAPEPVPTHRRGASGRILVMDDDDSVRWLLETMLGDLGYASESASHGGEAIELYRESVKSGDRFDAVLMDLTVAGGMGGRETVEHLAAVDPDVKAIVVSGYSNDPVMASHRSYGFCGCLEKPFEETDLARVLEEVL